MSSTVALERPTDPSRTPIPIIDCDTHNELVSVQDLYPYLSASWREHIDTFGVRTYSGNRYPRFLPARPDAWSPEGHPPGTDPAFFARDHLDRHGIAYAILIPLRWQAISLEPRLNRVLATAANDWQEDRWIGADPRFRATLAVPTEDPAAAVAEIERRAGEDRYVQVQFVGHPAEPMGRTKYWPIFEAAEAAGLPVMTHAFGTTGNPLTGAGWASYYLEEHINASQTIQANVTSMIMEGVFERYPGLRLLSVENTFGWYPSLLWRLDRAWSLFRAELPHLTEPPSHYLRRNVYAATQPVLEPPKPRYLPEFLDLEPAIVDRLVFSSDYPHWDGDNPAFAIPERLPRDMRERILFRNAAQLYGLTVADVAPNGGAPVPEEVRGG